MVATHPSMDGQTYLNGTTIGFSMDGNMINPTWLDYGPDGAFTPVLIAAFVFTPTTAEFSSDITVSLSDWTFGGDEGELVFACDMSTDCPQDPS